MKTGIHFVNYGLPEYTGYSEQVVRDTTWYTYEWLSTSEGVNRGAVCLIDERGYVILYDYTQRPFFTTLYESVSAVVKVLKFVLVPHNDMDRQRAIMLITGCPRRGSYILFNERLSEVCKKHLEYRGFTISEVRQNDTLLKW